VIMSDTRAAELGIKPLARIVATGLTALEPEFMGLGPIQASKQALQRAGMTIGETVQADAFALAEPRKNDRHAAANGMRRIEISFLADEQ